MMQEGKIFSSELLANIHIKLDKEGLEGISEKELMVLLDDRAARRLYETSTEIVEEIGSLRTSAIKIGWYILGTLITIALGIIANLIVALIVK
jgi:hypothetical protein